MNDRTPKSINLVFGRDGKVLSHGYARECNEEESVAAHEIMSNPGEKVFHSIEIICGVEYDFVATLKPRAKK